MAKRVTTEEQFERLLETATPEQLERMADQISLTKRLRFPKPVPAPVKRTRKTKAEEKPPLIAASEAK